MKQFTRSLAILAVLLLLISGAAVADSLSVTNGAAMAGSFGLQVFHDNSSVAFVQDNTPTDESVYRFSFMFDPNSISPGSNLRQAIFQAIGTNPNPGVGACNTAPSVPVIRIWLYLVGGAGQNYTIQGWANGNQCGPRGTARISIPSSGPKKICAEWQIGPSNTGSIAVAVVDTGNSCPASGDVAYEVANVTNQLTDIDIVRMGIPATNNFGAGESGDMYYDEFESFRTLAP